MVTVKVRETYDLHTVKNKMTVIAIHTPKPDIIEKNYPGLLMQCKAYRPKSCNVRVACASVLPLDIKGVGLAEGDVAPEDVFNPILYKAMSNKGMSQLEARINALVHTGSGLDLIGNSADVEVDTFTTYADEFQVYYALLSNTREWKHAHPQQGLTMSRLRPLVYEMVYNVGDMNGGTYEGDNASFDYPNADGSKATLGVQRILGKAKPMPFIPCTSYTYDESKAVVGQYDTGFQDAPKNAETKVPWLNVVVGTIITPPSRLHEIFYRMVVEWEIEFSGIRPIGEITAWSGLNNRVGPSTHFQNYSYESTKKAIEGEDCEDSILDNEACMVSANVGIEKVM